MKDIILLIEDEEDICSAFVDAMSELDVYVLTAETGEDGVELYRLSKDGVSLVVLDLSLPGISGEETFKRLKKINPAVRVVLSTGYSREYVAKAFRGQELEGYLHKPYSLSDLVESMGKFLRGSTKEPA